MTTILADHRLGVMVADSCVSDEDRVWARRRKVYRYKGALYGLAGSVDEAVQFMEWVKGKRKAPKFTSSDCLMMNQEGLFRFGLSVQPVRVPSGIDSIGSGSKAAICTYEALAFTDPVTAVKIVCKHDMASRTPVRTYRL